MREREYTSYKECCKKLDKTGAKLTGPHLSRTTRNNTICVPWATSVGSLVYCSLCARERKKGKGREGGREEGGRRKEGEGGRREGRREGGREGGRREGGRGEKEWENNGCGYRTHQQKRI